MSQFPRAFILASVFVFGACTRQQNARPTERDAVAVVSRYLIAEGAGLDTSATLHVYGCENDAQGGSDMVEPVKSASVLDVRATADTFVIRVVYDVMGRAYLGKRSRFAAAPKHDTVSFRVSRDTLGQLRILCNAPPATHWLAGTVSKYLPTFDSVSRQVWERTR